jgi:hypothetical protein
MRENGTYCQDCNSFITESVTLCKGSVEVCKECAKKDKYNKYLKRNEIRYMPKSAMRLLPPEPGKCQECAREHNPELPHDKNSIYYVTKFYQDHGRSPTWDDAMAHCTDEMKKSWKETMARVEENSDKFRS